MFNMAMKKYKVTFRVQAESKSDALDMIADNAITQPPEVEEE